MARPKTKDELIDLSNKNYNQLNKFIESLSLEEQAREFPKGTMNKNIRDVLTHLHHWHLMMINWYKIGMSGRKPEMPAKGYTWKDTQKLNKKIWNDYQNVNLHEAKSLLNNSFEKIQKIIQTHSNEELFEKKRYKWTGTTSLGSYLISATSSHYDWAYKLIKKAKNKSNANLNY
ncbi:MAG: ClbS/DfsB family four-helix bundle protein [Flavobacteriales bacterium]